MKRDKQNNIFPVKRSCIYLFLILLCFLCSSCGKETETAPLYNQSNLYFPPPNSSSWETVTPESLNWNTQNLNELYAYLSDNKTRAFILLKDGKIALEMYWGKNILNTATFNSESQWYWASAGKTITALLTGIAQQEDLLNIDDQVSDYLGTGWTSLPLEKENLITIRNQLTMTTGLDYTVSDINCFSSDCLRYNADAGKQWYYHTAPYTLLKDVISNASGLSYNDFTDQKLKSKIGMNGNWVFNDSNNIYWSTARDVARFGLLILNKGQWENEVVLADEKYFEEMTTSSQELNPSYGYLWWLNGQASIIYPGLAHSFNNELSADAPDDLIAGVGKNGQFIEIIPSKNIVIVRMGETPDGLALAVNFHNEMWQKINQVLNE